MSKDNLVWLGGGLLIVAVIGWWGLAQYFTPGKHDALAQCLSQRGVKIYGAYWCSHCQEQKREFGKSWKYVNYVECSLPNKGGQTPACKKEGIESYPTWQMADGSRVTGVIELRKLAELNGCREGAEAEANK